MERKYTIDIDFKDDDVYTLDEWNDVKNVWFHNDDGSGYWAKDGKYSREDEVFSSTPLDASHVVWFNK